MSPPLRRQPGKLRKARKREEGGESGPASERRHIVTVICANCN